MNIMYECILKESSCESIVSYILILNRLELGILDAVQKSFAIVVLKHIAVR